MSEYEAWSDQDLAEIFTNNNPWDGPQADGDGG